MEKTNYSVSYKQKSCDSNDKTIQKGVIRLNECSNDCPDQDFSAVFNRVRDRIVFSFSIPLESEPEKQTSGGK
jgi:hypothetical protein